MGCRSHRYLVGVDEAGRGSLVGEMIVAGYAVQSRMIERIVSIGVRDSKELAPSSRASLYRELASLGIIGVHPVKPQEIDRRNLTSLTEDAIYSILKRITRIIGTECVERVVIDRYGAPRRIHSMALKLGIRASIMVEEKADSRYPEVAAASIIAKHVRDQRIMVLRILYGLEGSGYPSDPRTIEWLNNVIKAGERPPIIRYSWGTLRGTGLYREKRRGASLDDFM